MTSVIDISCAQNFLEQNRRYNNIVTKNFYTEQRLFTDVYCGYVTMHCKKCLPYNLYCVGGDVKHCTIQYNLCIELYCMFVCALNFSVVVCKLLILAAFVSVTHSLTSFTAALLLYNYILLKSTAFYRLY